MFKRAKTILDGVVKAEAVAARSRTRKCSWDDKEDVKMYRRVLAEDARGKKVPADGVCPKCKRVRLAWVIKRGGVVVCKSCDQKGEHKGGRIKDQVFTQKLHTKVKLLDLLGHDLVWWKTAYGVTTGKLKRLMTDGWWVDSGVEPEGTVIVDRRVVYELDPVVLKRGMKLAGLSLKALGAAVKVSHVTLIKWMKTDGVELTSEISHRIWDVLTERRVQTGDKWWVS